MALGNIFNSYGGATISYDASADQYAIVTAINSTRSGGMIKQGTIVVPYGATSIMSCEMYLPSSKNISIDINNVPIYGALWSGNDHDNISKRLYNGSTSYKITIPAQTWTKVSWQIINTADANTDKVGLNVYDSIGVDTSDDTESITYYIRNLTATISGGGTMDLRLSENTFTQKNVFSAQVEVTSSSTEGAVTILNGGLVASDNIKGAKVYNVMWNDFVDRIPVDDSCDLEYGRCYCFDGEKYTKSSKYMQPGYIGIHSDTAGFEIGYKGKSKELCCSVAGFVLAYVDKDYRPGTALTCTEDGVLTEMREEDKREWPERIVAIYWKDEPSKMWGLGDEKVKVNGRKWVKVR